MKNLSQGGLSTNSIIGHGGCLKFTHSDLEPSISIFSLILGNLGEGNLKEILIM